MDKDESKKVPIGNPIEFHIESMTTVWDRKEL
jgi:hypothetical protein